MKPEVAMDSQEEDAFKARQLYNWSPGLTRWIKRKHNKRVRQHAKSEIRKAVRDGDQ